MPPSPDERRRADRERGARVLYVHMLLAELLSRKRGEPVHVSLATFGEWIAEEEGEPEPYSPSSVSRWESGKTPPSIHTVEAMCRVVNKIARKRVVDPGWVSHGPASTAEGPKNPVITLEMLATTRPGRRRKS